MALTPDPELADVLIVNTCSFIDMAKKESIDAVFGAVHGASTLAVGAGAAPLAGANATGSIPCTVPARNGREPLGDHGDVGQSSVEQCCDEVLILLPECTQLRDAEAMLRPWTHVSYVFW